MTEVGVCKGVCQGVCDYTSCVTVGAAVVLGNVDMSL